jgi:superfamily II DNA or RNA helicase
MTSEATTALELYARVPGGPLAEGDLVLSTNPIYEGHGVGQVTKVKGEQAKVEFSPSVFSTPPFRSVNWILRLPELRPILSPLAAARAGVWDDPARFDLRQMAARLLCANKGGQLGNARTEILPHQIFTAHAVVKSPHRRFLLADEVGLGKTVEAGMVWQALLQRGQANRTLIVTPAGLTLQWQEEMKEKFGADFEVFLRDFSAVNPRVWDLKAQAIASLQALRLPRHREILLENRRWNLIIFDEAQHLSAREWGSDIDRTKAYQLAEGLKNHTDALLLLTATPHQGDPDHSRFRNLLLLLSDRVDFTGLGPQRSFIEEGTPRYTELVLRTPKDKVTDSKGRAVFRGRKTWPVRARLFTDGEQQFYEAVAEYIREGYKALERVQEPDRRRAIGYVLTVFQRLNASSVAAAKSALRTRRERLHSTLADLVREVPEETMDERFEGEWDERQAPIRVSRALLADEIAWLDRLMAMPVPRERKAEKLRDLVARIHAESSRGPNEKVLIFTEFRKTQEFIVERLQRDHGPDCVTVIHGGLGLDGKREAQRAFRENASIRFLVSTEAGGEGINLQFCHVLVNYDMPWNPMRVEQRVGRIYRFGQDKVVQIYNFTNQGTVEDKVQTYFDNRLRLAAQALCRVTHQDPEELYGTLGAQVECETNPEDIYRRAIVEGDLNPQSKKEIEEAVTRAHQAYEIATTSLFRDVSAFSFDRYQRELASGLTLDDLRQFTEEFLRGHGRSPQWHDGRITFKLPDALRSPDLPERISDATFDREAAIRDPHAPFLAIGDDFVDAMLHLAGAPSSGGYTARRRIECEALRGRSGAQFNFLVRSQVPRADGDEYLFDLRCAVVGRDYEVDEDLSDAADRCWSRGSADGTDTTWDWEKALGVARRWLESRIRGLWDWDEEVLLLSVAEIEAC